MFHVPEVASCACLDVFNEQCVNGGTCIDNEQIGAGTTCTCPCGFAGSKCAVPISECCNYGSNAPNSCLNGATCVDVAQTGSPECQCTACFTGEFCDSGCGFYSCINIC
mgnify:FL=1